VTRLRVLVSRVLDVVLRRQRESRLSEEIQNHLELLTDQYVAQGMSPADARAAARREFGGVDQIKETYRDQRGFPLFETIVQDLRFAFRMLGKDRRFAVATVLALGLGVGSVSAVFTILNTMMFRALPFAEADRLVGIQGRGEDRRDVGVSYADYETLARNVTAFESLAANANDQGTVIIVDVENRDQYPPGRARRTRVSSNAFAVLGWATALGRSLRTEDDLPGAPAVVVISDDLWRLRYNADPAVIGRSVLVDDVPSTIVGVMPPRFTWPVINQLWQPLGRSLDTAAARERPSVTVTGRLRPGVTLAQVNAQLDAAAKSMPVPAPPLKKRDTFTASFLSDNVRGGNAVVPVVWTLMGVAALVLVIACANVASLLLARSMTRAREIAIRSAIGATRWRIVRQILIECLVLASVAGVLGIILSRFGARLLASGFDVYEEGAPNVTPFWVDLSMDGFTYLFVASVCVVTTLVFGLGPALYLSRANAASVLKDGARSSTVRTQRWSGALVTCEIALTLVLMTTAGLMWRTFLVLRDANLVIDTSRLTTMKVTLPTGAGQSDQSRREFVARLDERLVASGRFSSATLTAAFQVIGHTGTTRQLAIAGRASDKEGKPPTTQVASVGDRYFETLRLPIVRGRALAPDDGGVAREAVVVNEAFAERFFPNEDPIGQRIQLVDPGANGVAFAWHTVVGVARSIPSHFVNQQPPPLVYVPLRSAIESPRSVMIVLGDVPLATAASLLREEVRALNPSLALYAIQPLDRVVEIGRNAQKLLGTFLGGLASIALVLASVGVFALTAHNVVQRTQEIGVRMALGAPVGRVLWLFLRRSLTHLAIGLTLGMWGALSAGKLFGSFVLNGGATDYPTTSLVTLVLVVVAALSSTLPARRAAKVDPLVALRHD
jgi:putative ABC transport system permease protein